MTDLLFEEINRTVADAIATGEVLWASNAARKLMKAYSDCAFTEREIEDLVVGFAAKAGVPVEFGHPSGSDGLPLVAVRRALRGEATIPAGGSPGGNGAQNRGTS